jgi:uncharacterized membrane protein
MVQMTLIDTFGKFHPVLLHLPIGILIYAYLHLGFDLFILKKKKAVDITFALAIGVTTAVLSCISGYLLSENGDYGGDILDWHKWLGIGTAIGSVLLFITYRKSGGRNVFYGLFTVFMILLTVTGHYGGSLTHGEGFLLPSAQESETNSGFTEIPQANIFVDVAFPISKRKCQSCHNPKKKKGKLLLNTLEGWKKGGKTGDFIVPGDTENSLVLSRIHLPLSEKKHMPPSGKMQLDTDEIRFIEWWISSMKTYDDKVEDLSPPPHIMKFITQRLEAQLINAPLIDDGSIASLRKDGIPVTRISKDKPWIAVSYPRGRKVKKSDFQKLRKYNENVRQLILSDSGLNDNSLTQLNDFVNLKSLDISLNSVSSDGIKKLQGLTSLESLNLYGTEVDRGVLQIVSSFPALIRLYLWKTNVENADVIALKLPENLEINIGQNLDVFGEVQLLPPDFETEKVIFQDSILISLAHVAGNAKIYYTLNGDLPNENTQLYSKPIVLKNTIEVKAMAKMDGWENSAVVTKSFLKSTSLPQACDINPPPSDRYKAEGNLTLIDSEKGSEQFSDGKWLGFSAQDVTIALDLGKEKEIRTISFGSLRDYQSYIFNPIGVSVLSSSNGIDYTEISRKKYAQITQPEEILITDYVLDLPETNTRYLKIEIIAQKKNPDWHPDPGADSWLFLDEIIID